MPSTRRPAPISAAMIARSRTVAEPRWSPGAAALGWLDSFDGRTDLVVVPADGSGPPAVVSAAVAVTPTGAYGGGGWCWAGDDQVVIAAADGRLVLVRASGGGVVRVLARDGSAFAPAVSPDGAYVAFCIERDDSCDVAVVPLDGSRWPWRLSEGADFAWDPAWSADSRTLAWHEWDLPGMSWDASRIARRDIHVREGSRVVAGGEGVAVGQPRFSPDGASLAYVSDAEGWNNVWVARADGSRPRPLRSEECEHAEPAWGPGARSFAWSPDSSRLAYCRNEAGFGRLVVAPVGGRGAPREIAKAWHRGIDWSARGIVAVRSGAVTPDAVVVTEAETGARDIVARGPVGGFEEAGLVEPEPVSWPSGRMTVHGLLYRPAVPALGAGTKPPLLVNVHGGPTDQAVAQFRADTQYFVARGWAVLAPNARGSSGHGRAYTQALNGEWGAADVDDVAAGIRYVVRRGWCDRERVAIRGGSAGGYTVLLMCARHGDMLRAGVSLFGVTDLFDLAATTHRFESRYLDRLVGELPVHAERYRDRSPITHAAQIRVPLLVLQGEADKVVPRAQADALVDAMRGSGTPVEYHVYEGEGHGFRQIANRIDELERTEAFLDKWVLQR